MRPSAGPRVRTFVRSCVVAVLLAGCWSSARPASPQGPSALIRRHHVVGDVLAICERVDATIVVPNEAPVSFERRAIRAEHVIAATREGFERRIDTSSDAARIWREGDDSFLPSGVVDVTGTPYPIDVRGRPRGISTTPRTPQGDRAAIQSTLAPSLEALFDFESPEGPIRASDHLPIHQRWTVTRADALPSDVTLDLEIVVEKVTPERVELSCTGRQREAVRARAAPDRIAARMDFEIACRGWISRTDGRTARWSVDMTGAFAQTVGERATFSMRGHHDVAIGAADAEVCVRAAQRGPIMPVPPTGPAPSIGPSI